jgi:hypothetical protein
MTALAACYTKSGFVIGADSRSRTYDAATDKFSDPRDDCQKIFKIEEPGKVLAYAVMGDVRSDGNSFDLMEEIEHERERLSGHHFSNLYRYARAIGRRTEKAYEKALRSGRLEFHYYANAVRPTDNLLARVLFVGYMSLPDFLCIELFRTANGAELQIKNMGIQVGRAALAASEHIREAVDTDPGFAEYRIPSGPTASLEEAHAVVKRRIEACASPLAQKIDPLHAAGIGGEIQVAAVTPSNFKWLEKPKHCC